MKFVRRATFTTTAAAPASAVDDDSDSDDDEDFEDVGIDVVANKGGASIFLLHGPPGT